MEYIKTTSLLQNILRQPVGKKANADKEQLERGVYGKMPVGVTKSFNMFFTWRTSIVFND
jgi:hypothetical protein